VNKNLKLSHETLACLRDESFAIVCRLKLTEELKSIEAEKEKIKATRPLLGILASRATRNNYDKSLQEITTAETEIRRNLIQIQRLENWLRSMIYDSLNNYLTLVSPDHQLLDQIETLIQRWQNGLAALTEQAIAFARDARVALTEKDGRNQKLHAMAGLRISSDFLHGEAAKITQIARKTTRISAGKISAQSQLPALPTFRTSAWVDRILVWSPEDCDQDLKIAETEARNFCSEGKTELLIKSDRTRALCVELRKKYIEAYWEKLRGQLPQHDIDQLDANEVIKELTKLYVTTDLKRRQSEIINNPYVIPH
jgi:hypothetical protein